MDAAQLFNLGLNIMALMTPVALFVAGLYWQGRRGQLPSQLNAASVHAQTEAAQDQALVGLAQTILSRLDQLERMVLQRLDNMESRIMKLENPKGDRT